MHPNEHEVTTITWPKKFKLREANEECFLKQYFQILLMIKHEIMSKHVH